jgi:hypothetical protein
VTRILGYIWASPLVLVALLVLLPLWALGQAAPLRWDGGLAWAWQVRAGSWLDRRTSGWSGFTAGWLILYMPSWDVFLVVSHHEREHVRQAFRWGPLMPFAYLVCLAIWGYWKNPFEVAARLAAQDGVAR